MHSQSLLLQEMIKYYTKEPAVVRHILKAHSLSILISDLEGMNEDDQQIIGAASILHEMALDSSQAEEDPLAAPVPDMARAILAKLGYDPQLADRICFLASNKWQAADSDDPMLQILLESCRLAEFHDSPVTNEIIRELYNRDFRTSTGKALCQTMFSLAWAEEDSEE